MYTIYLITNKVNGKVYVGQTRQKLNVRWNCHKRDAKYGSNLRICRALRKYGPDSFEMKAIATADTQDWADYLERVWIIIYDSRSKDIGYNIREGGNHSPGMSPEGRESLRQKNTGRLVPEERKAAASVRMKAGWQTGVYKGVPHTDEAKAKMKLAHQGPKHNTFRHDVLSEEIVSLWNHGASTVDVAKHLSMSMGMVYDRIKQSGLEYRSFDSKSNRGPRRPPMSEETLASAIELRARGATFENIAHQLGCDKSTLSRRLKHIKESN